MGPVRKYKVTVNGHETVMRLNDRDAARYPDAQPVDAAPTAEPEAEPQAKARTRTPNKARTPRSARNKSSE